MACVLHDFLFDRGILLVRGGHGFCSACCIREVLAWVVEGARRCRIHFFDVLSLSCPHHPHVLQDRRQRPWHFWNHGHHLIWRKGLPLGAMRPQGQHPSCRQQRWSVLSGRKRGTKPLHLLKKVVLHGLQGIRRVRRQTVAAGGLLQTPDRFRARPVGVVRQRLGNDVFQKPRGRGRRLSLLQPANQSSPPVQHRPPGLTLIQGRCIQAFGRAEVVQKGGPHCLPILVEFLFERGDDGHRRRIFLLQFKCLGQLHGNALPLLNGVHHIFLRPGVHRLHRLQKAEALACQIKFHLECGRGAVDRSTHFQFLSSTRNGVDVLANRVNVPSLRLKPTLSP